MKRGMRAMALIGTLILAPGLAAGPAHSEDVADPAILGGMVADSDAAVMRVRDAITSFHGRNDRWPNDFAELVSFATTMGRPIDTAAFAEAAYSVGEANGGKAALFEYVMAATGAKGAFAITFNGLD